MVLFEDALNTVLSRDTRTGVERVSISGSPGRVLAEDIFSDMDMPPFDKSAVDGFACRFADIGSPLTMIETIPAGAIPCRNVTTGQCAKIMTGAMVPAGADCVVMVEDTETTGADTVKIVRVNNSRNICYKGEDIRTGDLVLRKGTQITPAHIAVLAATGATNPLVAKLPSVGIISTGDELVEPHIKPATAQIRNSNAWQLEAQVKSVPATPVYLGIAPDNGPELRDIIEKALSECDVVLLTGGVSMGDFDFVPAILQEAGVSILFKSIAIQPGKPTVFGYRGGAHIFGLPGNPVSSFVLFEIMVRPFLQRMQGSTAKPVEMELPMGVDFSRRNAVRKTMIPAEIRDGAVFPVEYHGSAHIQAYTVANCMLVMEIGTTFAGKGETVHVRQI